MAKQNFGKYEVQERLGRGGMAEVYRAYHANLDRYVAIKVLHAFLAEDDEFRVRFEKEARNIAKLNHPHIVQVYDFDFSVDTDSYYMVMELVDGVTLKDLIYDMANRDERLALPEVLRIIREAASALAYAHNSGMIHRDVKPANLMIDKNNRVVLTDFGIAKMLDSKQLTVSGGMIGTPAYMSPEQGLGEPGDERSDLYSLGVIMYQLLVGTLPFDAETALGVILMHVNDPVPEIHDFDPDLPDMVQQVVQHSMAKDPEERYQSAAEMIADIEACERELGVGEVTRLRPPKSKRTAEKTPDKKTSTQTKALSKPAKQEKSNTRRLPIILGLVLFMMLGIGGYGGAAFMGFVPDFGVFSQVPLSTPTDVVVATETPVPVLVEATETPTDAPTETATSTPEPSPTATLVPTETSTDLPTATPTTIQTEMPTADATMTFVFAQTATAESCIYDFAIVEQLPEDGEAGGFFRVDEPYVREITFLNTGTCEWGENTSMTFVSGEDFNAGPRIFIRESLQVGDELTVLFEGTSPQRGSLDPFIGTWQLRTRGQIPIGEPFEISVLVFDPGT